LSCISAIGVFNPGVVYVQENNTFSSFPISAGEMIVSTGPNTFAGVSNIPQSRVKGVVQRIIFPISGTGVNLPVGNDTSNYNAASQLFNISFIPRYSTSFLSMKWNVTSIVNAQTNYYNLYAFLGPTPLLGASCSNTDPSLDYLPCSGMIAGQFGSVVQLNLQICGFSSAGTGQAYSAGSYAVVTEYNTLGEDVVTATATSTSATPVLIADIPVNGGTSLYVSGTCLFADVNGVLSNGSNFSTVVQFPSAGVASMVGGGPIGNSLSTSPSLSFAIVSNNLQISAVGIAGETFDCTLTYKAIQSVGT